MFMLIGAAEKAGSGVDKMRRGWASQHWRSPIVREQVQPDRVIWHLPMVSLIPEASLDRLKNIFGNRFTQFNTHEVQALVTAEVEGAVDNARMRQMSALHVADVTRLLQGLVGKQALVQEGQGRWSRYRLAGMIDSEHNSVRSEHNSVRSEHKLVDSEHNSVRSEHKLVDSEHNSVRSEQREVLLAIAAPARNQRRLPHNEMGRLILELCRDCWLTRNELASLLARNPDGLRQRFLNPMLRRGMLRLRYPDKPNHADQAYTASDLVTRNKISSTGNPEK